MIGLKLTVKRIIRCHPWGGHGYDPVPNFEEIKKIALNDEIKKEYQQNSEDAIKNDVFGAPSYVFNNEIFWGQDRLDYLEEALKK